MLQAQHLISIKDEPLSLKCVLKNFNKEYEVSKTKVALKGMIMALNSDEFETFCKNPATIVTYYTGWWFWKKKKAKVYNEFLETDLSPTDVYNRILFAKEVLNEEIDGEADIELNIDRSWSWSAIGYTYPDDEDQFIYSSFFYNSSFWDIAGNICHEWTHKLGFGHAYKPYLGRPATVPYAVGYFVRDWCKRNEHLIWSNDHGPKVTVEMI